MRLYRLGDVGEPIRDIQARLRRLGFAAGPTDTGRFDEATRAAVTRFQQARGLGADGIVGPDTWRALVAAGFRLGDRTLYHRVPMMRGDDVAELQRSLNALGFDSGKVDGIFGPDTLRALLDFQHNRDLPEDGIAGRVVAEELRLMARATAKPGREVVRERQWLLRLPPTVAGQRVYIDSHARDDEESTSTWKAALTLSMILKDLGAHPLMSRSADAEPPERIRALRANRLSVDFIVSFSLPGDGREGVFFFATERSRSSAGERMAEEVAACLGTVAEGRAVPILKDTKAPAILVAVDPMNEHTGGRVAQGIMNLFARAFDDRTVGTPVA